MRNRLLRTINYLLALSAVYLVLDTILPISSKNQHLYHLSNISAHVLQLVLALPLIAIWLAAFYGYVKLRQYADSLKDSKEAKGYRLLAKGCMWLAWGKPIVAIITAVLNAIANKHAGFESTATIIINYVDILVPLISFSILSNGSRKLLEQTKQSLTPAMTKLLILVFVALGVVYCYIIFRPISLTSITRTSGPYYLPVWLTITTITIPSLYTWLIGLLAVGETVIYSQKTHGLLYKQAVQLISVGIIAVIASAIAFQYVSSIDPAIRQMSLDYLLISNYLIKLMGAIGFIAIAAGAIRLKRIEDV